MRILIIEDEAKTARELERNIREVYPEAEIAALLQSIRGSVKWLGENASPDLIFSDIQLADGLSFEIFKTVDPKAPIVFCTAFDQYAIEAFQTSGIDYLLKPIDKSKLKQSLEKYGKMKAVFSPEENRQEIAAMLQQLDGFRQTILVHSREKTIPVRVADIAYLHFELGSVYLMTFENSKYFVPYTLDELEAMFNPDLFFRANRQFIVNRKAVLEVEHYEGRRMLLQLKQSVHQDIIISKVKAPLLLRWMEKG